MQLKPDSFTLLDKAKTIGLGFAAILIWVFILKFGFNWLITPAQFYYDLPFKYLFVTAVIFAPLWEEAVFRHLPIQVAKAISPEILIPTIIASSIIFGLGHNGNPYWSILCQGVIGFILSIVYIKNNYCYWSSVILHALWNFSCLLILA